PAGGAQFDLALGVGAGADGGEIGRLTYATALFDRATVARLAGQLAELLAAAAAAPGTRLSALPLLAAAERWQTLAEGNDTAAEIPADSCLADPFERQAEPAPAAAGGGRRGGRDPARGRAHPAGDPPGPPPARLRRGAGRPGRRLRPALGRAGRRPPRGAEGGRRPRATRPGLPGGAAGGDAR